MSTSLGQYADFGELLASMLKQTGWDAWRTRIASCPAAAVDDVLAKPEQGIDDLWALLAPLSPGQLERMAQQAHRVTLQRFGRTVLLYAPLYVSNFCSNACVYCGFNCRNRVARRALSVDEAEEESALIRAMGFQHILLVSGEDPRHAGTGYFTALASRLRHQFSSIGIEVQPLSSIEYAELIACGVDSVTCYQETYNPTTYERVHRAGPKRDYARRLGTLERAAAAGIRKVGLSPLYGLDDWRVEALMAGVHAHYMATRFWRTQVSISFPRLRPAAGGYEPPCPLDDAGLAQLICAFRLVLPDVHLVLSTREPAGLRDRLLPLGITQMSAGSRTSPLGYSHDKEAGEQFTVMDERSPDDVCAMISAGGYEPVWKDWDESFLNG